MYKNLQMKPNVYIRGKKIKKHHVLWKLPSDERDTNLTMFSERERKSTGLPEATFQSLKLGIFNKLKSSIVRIINCKC